MGESAEKMRNWVDEEGRRLGRNKPKGDREM